MDLYLFDDGETSIGIVQDHGIKAQLRDVRRDSLRRVIIVAVHDDDLGPIKGPLAFVASGGCSTNRLRPYTIDSIASDLMLDALQEPRPICRETNGFAPPMG